MGAAFDVRNRHAGVQMDGQAHPLRVDLVGNVQFEHRRIGGQLFDFPLTVSSLAILGRRSAGSARLRVPVLDAAFGRGLTRRDARALGLIAWPHHQRNDQFVGAVQPGHGLGVGQRHLDRQAGHQVGDVLGEHVRAVLAEQGGAPALALGFLEGGAGFLDPLNPGLNPLVADFHGHGVDGGGFVEREQIGGVHRPVQGIGEGLGDRDPRHVALHVGVDVGLEQRQGHGLAVHLGFDASAQIVGNGGQRVGQGQPGQNADENKLDGLHGLILQGSKLHGRELRKGWGRGQIQRPPHRDIESCRRFRRPFPGRDPLDHPPGHAGRLQPSPHRLGDVGGPLPRSET